MKSGKPVIAWAAEGDLDADAVEQHLHDGVAAAQPKPPLHEIDRAGWFALDVARGPDPAQVVFVDRLERLGRGSLARRCASSPGTSPVA